MPDAKIIEADEGIVACPRCGETLLDEDGGPVHPYCEHVRFVFVNGDDFDYIDPDLELELANAKADNACGLFDTWEFLREKARDVGLILERTERGMACGPVSFTVWVGLQ
jgi:hypothetical protein